MEESREQRSETAYKKLATNLDEMTKSYRSLLDLIRKEKDFLIQSEVKKLAENNELKENMLIKIKTLDGARERYAKELADLVGADAEAPRLLDLAQKMNGPKGDNLRTVHATLELLVRRATEINRENEVYANSALKSLDGSLSNIKDTLVGKNTYERKGKLAYGPEKAGNFVSKEG